jgi:hypothetical protein
VREALISHLKKNFVFYFEDMVIPFGKLSWNKELIFFKELLNQITTVVFFDKENLQ